MANKKRARSQRRLRGIRRVPTFSAQHPEIEARLQADMERFGISRSFAIAWHVANSMNKLQFVEER